MPSVQPLRLLSAREAVSQRPAQKRALLVMQNLRLFRTVARVLRAIGVEAVSSEELGPPEGWIESSSPDLIVYDIDSETPESRDTLVALSLEEAAPSLILLSEGGDVPLLKDLLAYPTGYNLVLKNGIIDNGDLLVTARKLVERDIFGIDKYLRWGSIIHSRQAGSSEERGAIMERVRTFVEELQCENRYVIDILNAMDEFLTNAFFHAPTGEEGQSLFSNFHRSQVITLPSWRRPTIEYGSDGRLVGIAVRDPFGSLDTRKLLGHLAKQVERGLAEVNFGPGGAGIGLYVTYRSLDHLIINVEEGVATEFVGIVDVSVPYREHVRLPRTLNVFTLDSFAD